MIFANRYEGLLGMWYFFIDSTIYVENVLSLILVLVIEINKFKMINVSYPLMAFSVNVFLMCIRNFVFEQRQRAVTSKINNKTIDNLFISRTVKRYVTSTWAECKPGNIIKVKSG